VLSDQEETCYPTSESLLDSTILAKFIQQIRCLSTTTNKYCVRQSFNSNTFHVI